jgi:hypothetical protein
MASMLAQYMRGTAPQLHELPETARMLVVAYQARMDGMLAIAVDQHRRRLPQVTAVDRTRYQRRALEADEIIEGEVLDEDPAGRTIDG